MSVLMRISRSGLDLIESRCVCLLDSCVDTCLAHDAGYVIGWQHTGHDVKAGMHISPAQAEEMLAELDLPAFEGIVNRYAPMPQEEFDELVAVAFLLSRQ